MRHQIAHRKFSRSPAHRKALFRNMVTSFFKHERCETTLEKAKDLRPIAEKLVTLAKSDNLAARRKAYSYIIDKAVVHRLFTVIGPRCRDRRGGYTRVVRSGHRHGDAAQMAVIEFVDAQAPRIKGKKAKEEQAATGAPAAE